MFIAIVAPIGAIAQDDPNADRNDGRVILRQRVPLDYEKHLEDLAPALAAAGEVPVAVEKGDTVSAIIADNFGVGISNAPQAYEVFERHILSQNSLAEPTGLKALTKILVPRMPRIGLRKPNPDNPFNNFPKFALDSGIGSADSDRAGTLAVEADQRPGSQSAIIYREEDQANAALALQADADLSVESARIEISFEGSGGNASEEAISATETEIVGRALAAPAKQRPVLIVLDDSWPGDAEFARSRDFFRDALSRIRARFKFRDQDFSTKLLGAAAVSWVTIRPSEMRHSQKIAAALAPYRALEPAEGRVEVVYLPMFVREQGAAEIIEALVTADQVIDARQGQFDDWVPNSAVAKARIIAKDISNKLTKRANFDARSSDVAVVQAVLAFCDYYSRTLPNSCFVNMSWTTPDLWFSARLPSSNYGVFVAAAGNEGGAVSTLYTLKRQFAVRSSVPPGDVLAVMNVDTAGQPTCNSTVFGNVTPNLFAYAYSGAVDEAICGTSFAAPRVAWLLAAREAMRPRAPDTLAWRSAIWSEVTGSIDNTAQGYNRYRLRIPKLFQPQ